MATSNLQPLIDRRLDLLEQALLGLLPRQERREFITQIETRVKALETAGALTEADLPLAPTALPGLAAGSARPRGSKLSSLALMSGILGIGALLLLFAMPVTMILSAMLEEVLGETGIIAAYGSHVLLVALGGLGAVLFSIIALVRLSRQPETLRGRGWAITGLCTGPMPLFVGSMLALVTSVSIVASGDFVPPVVATPTVQASYGVTPTGDAASCTACPPGVVPGAYGAPLLPVPLMPSSTPNLYATPSETRVSSARPPVVAAPLPAVSSPIPAAAAPLPAVSSPMPAAGSSGPAATPAEKAPAEAPAAATASPDEGRPNADAISR